MTKRLHKTFIYKLNILNVDVCMIADTNSLGLEDARQHKILHNTFIYTIIYDGCIIAAADLFWLEDARLDKRLQNSPKYDG